MPHLPRSANGFRHHHAARKLRVPLALLAAALVGLAAGGSVDAQPRAVAGTSSPDVEPALTAQLAESGAADVVVALDDDRLRSAEGAEPEAWAAAVFGAQQAVLDRLPPGALVVTRRYERVPALAGRLSAHGLDALSGVPEVTAVSLDPPLELYLAESVPFIGADKLHLRHRIKGKGVTVAVLDTGTKTNNIDLRDAIVDEACIIDPPSSCPPEPHVSEDVDGHGTAVAGIIASRGRQSADGVAPEASIVSVKALETRGNLAGSDLAAALDWVLQRGGVDVVNMSLGGGGYSDYCDNASAYTRSLSAAIGRLNEAGTVVVAASGNDGSTRLISSPACIRAAVSVGAVRDITTDPKLEQFTNRNKTLDLLAPGVGIIAPSIRGQPSAFGGTSAAAPHVAGAAALLKQAAPWAGPELIVDVLKTHGQMPHLRYGSTTIRTIDVKSAYDALMKLTPTPTGQAPPSPSATPTEPEPAQSATPTISFPTMPPTTAPPSASPTRVASDTPTTAASAVPSATEVVPSSTPSAEVPIYLPAAAKP